MFEDNKFSFCTFSKMMKIFLVVKFEPVPVINHLSPYNAGRKTDIAASVSHMCANDSLMGFILNGNRNSIRKSDFQ